MDGTDFENLWDSFADKMESMGETPSVDPYDPESWRELSNWMGRTAQTPWDIYNTVDEVLSEADIKDYTAKYDGSVTSRAYMTELTVGIRRGIDRRVISSKRSGSLQLFPLVTQGSEVGVTKMLDVDGGIDYPPLYITLRSFVDVYNVKIK